MAANIPAKLKAADLTRFIIRAGQLELAKPVVAYWCEYWIVNQILAKGLHNGDDETLQYTMTLMDKLEKVKTENASNDAIVDDTAGQAYVEQFALETFQRADRAVQADKVTKQTADTFQAAATFLELVNIWASPDAETFGKIKYAKWNAVRIMKALKEGKDPNESNPKTEPVPEEGMAALDPNDPEVRALDEKPKSRQASVVEVPDEQDLVERKLARQSSIDQSLHPSAQVSARGSPAPTFEQYPQNSFPLAPQDDNVSPLEPTPPNERNNSIGGGYFPEVPTFTSETQEPSHPTAPPDDVIDLGLPEQPSFAPESKSPKEVIPGPSSAFDTQPPPTGPPQMPPQDFYKQNIPPPAAVQPRFDAPPQVPQQTYFATPSQQPFQQPLVQQQQAPVPQLRKAQLNTDDVAIAKAQKHARWAISALNFEDAETAVRELREALKTLGAS